MYIPPCTERGGDGEGAVDSEKDETCRGRKGREISREVFTGKKEGLKWKVKVVKLLLL